MIIERLPKQSTEDNLTDTVVEVFEKYPTLFSRFLRQFGSESVPGLVEAIHRRSRISHAFPEADLELQLGNRCPDIICICEKLIVVIESKQGARFTKDQLEDYQNAIEQVRGIRDAAYFLIAPKSTIYERYPAAYRVVTWDQVFDLFRGEAELHSYSDKLEAFRLDRYREILDAIVDRLDLKFANRPQKFSADKYHGYHIQLHHSPSILFAFSIYLSAPRYAKLFPFWLANKKTKMNSSDPLVVEYRKLLLELPWTDHHLERNRPGYIIDLFQSPQNTIDIIVAEVESLIDNQCKQMTDIYESICN